VTVLADVATRVTGLLPTEFATMAPRWLQAVGCPQCQGTGYQGRIGIYEFVHLSAELQTLILNRAQTIAMRQLANQQGFRTLREDGLIKAYLGMTSIEEVLRVTEETAHF
jgi:general secretion pathway protein E